MALFATMTDTHEKAIERLLIAPIDTLYNFGPLIGSYIASEISSFLWNNPLNANEYSHTSTIFNCLGQIVYTVSPNSSFFYPSLIAACIMNLTAKAAQISNNQAQPLEPLSRHVFSPLNKMMTGVRSIAVPIIWFSRPNLIRFSLEEGFGFFIGSRTILNVRIRN